MKMGSANMRSYRTAAACVFVRVSMRLDRGPDFSPNEKRSRLVQWLLIVVESGTAIKIVRVLSPCDFLLYYIRLF